MMRIVLAISLLTLAISSCKKSERPSDVMKPDTMQAVLWDVLKANAYATEYLSKDSGVNMEKEQVKLQLQVFAKHKITRADFDRSYDWYTLHPDKMQVMLDSMIARAERDKKTKILKPDRVAE